MKISAIQSKFYYIKSPQKLTGKKKSEEITSDSVRLPSLYYPCTNFLGAANSGKLKTLFSYGLPCMYSGIEMIDPKRIQKLLRLNMFNAPAPEVLNRTSQYKNSLMGTEAKVYHILEIESKKKPEQTIQDIIKDIAPNYKKILRHQQSPIFQKIIAEGKNLPEGIRYKFIQFMQETKDKLADKPIHIPFSTSEFKYKLTKIKDDIEKLKNTKANKVMNKLYRESERLPDKTSQNYTEIQQDVIKFMRLILRTSVLKNNNALKDLFDDALCRINGEKLKIPFNRKSFIYDLAKLLEDLEDKNLKESLLTTAETLPTSRECVAAYITKFSKEPSDKIMYRILWPSMASVEHIFPKSCGGIDDMSNYGGACTRENSDRKSIDFVEQIRRKPETKINCQKYVNRLIELAKKGVFAENNINTKYIEEFKNTIFEESQGQIDLDISSLYKI